MNTQTNTIKRRSIKHWNKDSVNGGPTSIEILITWLCKEGNYGRWKGGEAQGISKESLCSEIKAKMTEHGISHRLNSDIRGKIQHLQEKYQDAHQFLHKTGQEIIDGLRQNGMSEENIAKTMREKTTAKFAFFYQLQPVMNSDQALIAPPCPTSFQDKTDHNSPFSPGGSAELGEEECDDNEDIEETEGPEGSLKKQDSSGTDRPSKRVRRNVDTSISEILRRSEEMENRRNIQFEKRFEAEEAFRREQLRIQIRQLDVDEKRAVSESAQAQVNYAEMLKSLGLSNEEVLDKMTNMFK